MPGANPIPPHHQGYTSMKIWRRATVDGVFYRWIVEDVQTGLGAESYRRVITVRAEENPASTCKFVSGEVGHLWLFSATHSLDVRTRLVKACIAYALQAGWDPAGDQDFSAELTQDLLVRLRGLPGQN